MALRRSPWASPGLAAWLPRLPSKTSSSWPAGGLPAESQGGMLCRSPGRGPPKPQSKGSGSATGQRAGLLGLACSGRQATLTLCRWVLGTGMTRSQTAEAGTSSRAAATCPPAPPRAESPFIARLPSPPGGQGQTGCQSHGCEGSGRVRLGYRSGLTGRPSRSEVPGPCGGQGQGVAHPRLRSQSTPHWASSTRGRARTGRGLRPLQLALLSPGWRGDGGAAWTAGPGVPGSWPHPSSLHFHLHRLVLVCVHLLCLPLTGPCGHV